MPSELPSPTPFGALKAATRAVPALRYAMGLVGVAAAVALIRGFLPDISIVAMLPLLGGFAIAMTLLVIFATAAGSPERSPVAKVLLWAVCAFVIVFMLFTVTAVAFGWPSAWAQALLPKRAADAPLLFPVDKTDQNTVETPHPAPSGTPAPPLPMPVPTPTPAPVAHKALLSESEREDLAKLLTIAQLGPDKLDVDNGKSLPLSDSRLVCLQRMADALTGANAGLPRIPTGGVLGSGGTAGTMMGQEIDAQMRAIQITVAYLTNPQSLPSLDAYRLMMLPASIAHLYDNPEYREQATEAFQPLISSNCS